MEPLPEVDEEQAKWRSVEDVSSAAGAGAAAADHPEPSLSHHDQQALEQFIKHNSNSGVYTTKIGERDYGGHNVRRQGTFKLRTVQEQAALDHLTATIEANSDAEESLTPVDFTESDEYVQVMVRVRPLTARETKRDALAAVKVVTKETLSIMEGDKPKQYSFDHVFGPDDGQAEVYRVTMAASIQKFLAGFHACVFCYGQTGAGKSWTMLGSDKGEDTIGIAPRVVHSIFKFVKAQPASKNTSVKISALEIYNEQLRDLTRTDTDYALHMREAPGKGVFVQNLSEVEVASVEEVSQLLQNAIESRAIGSTNMNEESSRSHMVFMLALEQTDEQGQSRLSRLNLIDLAGSERAEASGATGARLKEGAAINQSLSCLGNVIHALAQGSQHVPYRNSKLTRLLSNSLGGNCCTKMIVNLSPADINATESLSSLRFAARAKLIKNKAVVNFDHTKHEISRLNAENKALREENERLRAALQAYQGAATPGGASGTDLILPTSMLPHIKSDDHSVQKRRMSIFGRRHKTNGGDHSQASNSVETDGASRTDHRRSSIFAVFRKSSHADEAPVEEEGFYADRRTTHAVVIGDDGRRESQACVLS